MFIGRIKKTDPKFTIAIALLFMVCLCIILFRTKIIVGQLKNKGDAAYKEGIFGDAEMYYGKALKKAPGQYVTLRAEMDLILALSACPQDLLPVNGLGPTDVDFIVQP